MRTISDYIAGVKHSLGKTPAAGHNLYHTLNDAGARLYSVHTWDFLNRGPIYLSVVAAQDYVELPDDFGGMIEAFVPNTGAYPSLKVVDLGAMASLRSTNVGSISGGMMYMAFDGQSGSATIPPHPRALLYPTPSTTGVPTIQMMYTKTWRVVTPSDNDKPVAIPFEFEDALMTGACLLAWNRENPEVRKDPTEYLYLIEQLKQAEGLNQPSQGYVRGGVNTRMGRNRSLDTTYGLADLGR